MSHIFISYSRKDKNFVDKIVQTLTEKGLDIWIDRDDIPKGELWEKEIQQGIEAADAFLFLISPDSVATGYCISEIEHAIKNGKRILPVVVRDTDKKTIQPEINKRNWTFCREGIDDFDKAIDDLCIAIHADYEWLKFHRDIQVKAVAWGMRKDQSRLLRGSELAEAVQRMKLADERSDPSPTKLQRDFIDASIRLSRTQRFGWTSALALLAGISCVAAIVLSILFDRVPAKAEIIGNAFEIRNRFNYRFLSVNVGSTITSSIDKPLRLTPDGGYAMVVGTGLDGERPGSVLVYDMKGNVLWEHNADDDPYNGPGGNFWVRKMLVERIIGKGEYQVLVTFQKSDWYPTELVLLDAEGKPLGSYWNSGFIYDVLPADFDGDGIKELAVSAVNNNLGYLVVNNPQKHPVIVYMLSPKEGITGQTFPDILEDIPSGTEYNRWIAVFDPSVVTAVRVRIVQTSEGNLLEVVYDPQGGYIQLDGEGRIQFVGISDHWQTLFGTQSPTDYVCFLTKESDGWYISGTIDEEDVCPWYVEN